MSVKCVVVGDGAVGKTSLITLSTNSSFGHSVCDHYDTQIEVDSAPVSITFWDTPGEDENARARPPIYTGASVFLLCYSVISPSSFDNVRSKWLPEIRHHSPHTPILLIALKADLRDDAAMLERLQQRGLAPVTFKQGVALADEILAENYFEVTALPEQVAGGVLDELLEALARAALQPHTTTRWVRPSVKVKRRGDGKKKKPKPDDKKGKPRRPMIVAVTVDPRAPGAAAGGAGSGDGGPSTASTSSTTGEGKGEKESCLLQ